MYLLVDDIGKSASNGKGSLEIKRNRYSEAKKKRTCLYRVLRGRGKYFLVFRLRTGRGSEASEYHPHSCKLPAENRGLCRVNLGKKLPLVGLKKKKPTEVGQ